MEGGMERGGDREKEREGREMDGWVCEWRGRHWSTI